MPLLTHIQRRILESNNMNLNFSRSVLAQTSAVLAANHYEREPAQNANVTCLVKHVNRSDKYSFDSVHKAFSAAMGKVNAKT